MSLFDEFATWCYGKESWFVCGGLKHTGVNIRLMVSVSV